MTQTESTSDNDLVLATSDHLTEAERVEVGIAECRRQIKRWMDRLQLLQSVRNQAGTAMGAATKIKAIVG